MIKKTDELIKDLDVYFTELTTEDHITKLALDLIYHLLTKITNSDDFLLLAKNCIKKGMEVNKEYIKELIENLKR